MARKLIWVGPEFTPYHEYFLDCLAADPRFELHVEMMDGPSQSHPFKLGGHKAYSWRIASQLPAGAPSVVDRVLGSPDAQVVVASYVHPTLLKVMKALASRGRRFIYFTDTPLPQSHRWHRERLEPRSPLRRIARSMRLAWIFRHASHVFATGQVGVDAAVQLGCPRDNAVVFPFFVPLPAFDPSRKDGTLRLVSIGQLIDRKGLDVALSALERAHAKLGDRPWTWEVIGDGPLRAELEARATASPFAGRILFRGWLQSAEIERLLAPAHVFLHPARWDPFPVAVLEAMASGLLVLGSDRSGSVVDRVRDGVNGFVHPVGDVDALSSHLVSVFESSERTRRMCVEARRTAEAWPAQRGADILAATSS